MVQCIPVINEDVDYPRLTIDGYTIALTKGCMISDESCGYPGTHDIDLFFSNEWLTSDAKYVISAFLYSRIKEFLDIRAVPDLTTEFFTAVYMNNPEVTRFINDILLWFDCETELTALDLCTFDTPKTGKLLFSTTVGDAEWYITTRVIGVKTSNVTYNLPLVGLGTVRIQFMLECLATLAGIQIPQLTDLISVPVYNIDYRVENSCTIKLAKPEYKGSGSLCHVRIDNNWSIDGDKLKYTAVDGFVVYYELTDKAPISRVVVMHRLYNSMGMARVTSHHLRTLKGLDSSKFPKGSVAYNAFMQNQIYTEDPAQFPELLLYYGGFMSSVLQRLED